MTISTIDVPVAACADRVVGLLGHRRTGWLRPFLVLARHAAGDAASGDVTYRMDDLVEVEEGCRAAALEWRPAAGAEVFTTFIGRLVVRERAEQVFLAADGEASGGSDRVNHHVLTRLVELLAVALAATLPAP